MHEPLVHITQCPYPSARTNAQRSIGGQVSAWHSLLLGLNGAACQYQAGVGVDTSVVDHP